MPAGLSAFRHRVSSCPASSSGRRGEKEHRQAYPADQELAPTFAGLWAMQPGVGQVRRELLLVGADDAGDYEPMLDIRDYASDRAPELRRVRPAKRRDCRERPRHQRNIQPGADIAVRGCVRGDM